jgi:hypothetical protein
MNFQKWLVNSDFPTRQKLLSSFKSHCYFLQKAFPWVSFLASKILKNSLAISIAHPITVLSFFRKETYVYIRFNDRKSLTRASKVVLLPDWSILSVLQPDWSVLSVLKPDWSVLSVLKLDWSVFITADF